MAASHTPFEKLEKICAKNPTSILFARLADGLLQKGEVKRAIDVCRLGLRYRPSYVAGHVVMGKCHLSSGRLEEARQEFQKVLQLDADHPVALWQLGLIDLEMGWEDLALQHFKRAYTLDPFNSALAQRIANLQNALQHEPLPSVPTQDGLGFEEDTDDTNPERSDLAIENISVPVPDRDENSAKSETIETKTAKLETSTSEPETLATLVEAIDRSESAEALPVDVVEPIATVTLAELYVGQGLIRPAMAVLERVLARNPENKKVKARLEELRLADASQTKE